MATERQKKFIRHLCRFTQDNIFKGDVLHYMPKQEASELITALINEDECTIGRIADKWKSWKANRDSIRACRIVLSNGNVVLDYFHNENRGMAFAGIDNNNYDNLFYVSHDEFLSACRAWIEQNIDNEDVESIEIF